MRYIAFLSLLVGSTCAHAAAPDDISANQRAWFDAVDLNANGDYTDNPTDSAPVSTWNDKSGSGNHIASSGVNRPFYRRDAYAADRHAVDFDGNDHRLAATGDIWSGAVSNTDIFIVTTTDTVKNGFIFASSGAGNNRLSAHIPWGNNDTYFDQGNCCSAPARQAGAVPITTSTPYLWHFNGAPTSQGVLQDGATVLSDDSAGVFNSVAASSFTLGSWPLSNIGHHGRIAEAIFYQRSLNMAQRRILSSYLSAKWNKAIATSATYEDIYNGDDAANGHYDYFVSGIGRDNGSQTTATTQGLTISDQSFLTSDNKYLAAGVDYLVTAPAQGTTGSDLPTDHLYRSNRSWYLDTTGMGGLVSLSFNAADIGIPIDNGDTYSLMHRTGTSGAFSQVATTTMTAGTITFSHLPADGIYALGKPKEKVELDIVKTVSNLAPRIGETLTFTLTVSNAGPEIASNASVNDVVPAGLTSVAGASHPTGTLFSVAGNTINWTGLTIPVGGTVVATYTADVVAP